MDQWMTNLPSGLTSLPLNRLAIPGSHESGTFNMTTDLSPSAPTALKLAAWIPGLIALLGNIIMDLSTTQSLTIGQQLQAGVRHFDFRAAWRDEDFYFIHTAYGSRIAPSLEEMKFFLDANPKEVIILDVQQFHQFNSHAHDKFIALLKATFGSKLCEKMNFSDITLQYMWTRNKQLVCIYEDDRAFQETELWTADQIESPWPDTPSPEVCVSKLTGYMDHAQNTTDKLFVCQAIVSPHIAYFLNHASTNRSIKSMTSELNPVFNPWLSDSPNQWTHQPNVVIHDFVEMDDFVQNVLNLNRFRNPSP